MNGWIWEEFLFLVFLEGKENDEGFMMKDLWEEEMLYHSPTHIHHSLTELNKPCMPSVLCCIEHTYATDMLPKFTCLLHCFASYPPCLPPCKPNSHASMLPRSFVHWLNSELPEYHASLPSS